MPYPMIWVTFKNDIKRFYYEKKVPFGDKKQAAALDSLQN